MIIDSGKLIYDGPLAVIKDRFGKFREMTFETAVSTGSKQAFSLNNLTPPAAVEIVNQEARAW